MLVFDVVFCRMCRFAYTGSVDMCTPVCVRVWCVRLSVCTCVCVCV